MKLGDLTDGQTGEAAQARVTGCAIDHRKVAPGTVFGAFRGLARDGEDFIADAVQAGAVAVVARPEASVPAPAIHIADAEPRRAFARLAARFFAPFPETVVAVTGTNGKTSTVELTRQLWRMQGLSAASIGTLGVTTTDADGKAAQVSTGLTTPDIVTFLSNMAGLRMEGVTHAAFEASSHGLAQFRTEGLPVRVVGFTNLSARPSRLSRHDGGLSRGQAAAVLRSGGRDGAAVVWADDEASSRVIEIATERGLRLITVGEQGQTLRLVDRVPTQLGQTLTIEAEGRLHKVNLPLIGAYQAANALVAAGFALATGGSLADVLDGRVAAAAGARPARARGDHRQGRAGLRRLRAYARWARGGDRGAQTPCRAADRRVRRGRRPRHRQAPRNGRDRRARRPTSRSSPTTIRAPRTRRASAPRSWRRRPARVEIGDRRAAIAAALAEAREGDVVLIAGKGHETGQIVGDRVLAFDDVQVARECAA